MTIAILSAKTGNGHNSVMNSLKKELINQGCTENEILCFPSFYEDMMLSNKILSGFYNFLMINSIALCNKYCEYTYINKFHLTDDFYNGCRDYIKSFIEETKADLIISVSHTINHAVIRAIDEMDLRNRITYSIVITDPYEPIATGFDVYGADKYICTSESVKKLLLKKQIPDTAIRIYDYPIDNKFINDITDKNKYILHLGLKTEKDIICINSGSLGINYYYNFLKRISSALPELQILFLCGSNALLYQRCSRLVEKNQLQERVKIFEFVSDMQNLLNISDMVITKAGANSFFEALATRTPIILDATEGILLQEKGMLHIVENKNIGFVLHDANNIISTVQMLMSKLQVYKENLNNLNIRSGVEEIVKEIRHS